MFDQFKLCAFPIGILTSLAVIAATPAAAQAPNLAGKNVTMLIGFGPGGGYDLWGRVVARHIGKHLPGNPTVVPTNMPGGGSFNAANHIYTIAPKDGTVLGIIARDAALGPMTGAAGARFDPLKITWVGTPTTETNVCIATAKAKVKTVKDLFENELIIGDTGVGTGTYSYPKALNGMLGTKFKLISGFPSSSGRVPGHGARRGRRHLRKSRQRRRQAAGLDREQEGQCPVPGRRGAQPRAQGRSVRQRHGEQRRAKAGDRIPLCRPGHRPPFVAPPDLPADRLKMLRDAFNATMKDPDFIADAKKQKLDVEPEDGEHLAALIKKIYSTPKPIVEKITELVK